MIDECGCGMTTKLSARRQVKESREVGANDGLEVHKAYLGE